MLDLLPGDRRRRQVDESADGRAAPTRPAVTTATGAVHSSSPARTATPSPVGCTAAGPVPNRTSAPWAAARSCSAATVAPARQRPPSGWNSTDRSKRMCGHRSPAASGVRVSCGAPQAARACGCRAIEAGSPWSTAPVVSSERRGRRRPPTPATAAAPPGRGGRSRGRDRRTGRCEWRRGCCRGRGPARTARAGRRPSPAGPTTTPPTSPSLRRRRRRRRPVALARVSSRRARRRTRRRRRRRRSSPPESRR